ncbi:hypothetical protein BDK51DRAFT_28776, partial [Blyttiomyces helicus]
LFMMQGLAELSDEPSLPSSWRPLGPSEVASLNSLLEGERAVTIWCKLNARRLLRRFLLKCMIRFGDIRRLKYADVASSLATLFNEDGVSVDSSEFRNVKSWMVQLAPETTDSTIWLQNQARALVSAHLQTTSADSAASASHVVISTLFLLPNAATFVVAYDPLFDRLGRIRAPYASGPEGREVTVGLLERVIVMVSEAVGDRIGLSSIFPRISEVAEETLTYLEDRLLAPGTDPLDMPSVAAHVATLDALLVRCNSPILKAHLAPARASELFQRWHHRAVRALVDASVEAAPYTFPPQLGKYTALRVLTVALDAAKKWGLATALTGLDGVHLMDLLIARTVFRKIPGAGNEAKKWSDMQNLFISAKFDAVRAALEQPESTAVATSAVFAQCVDELESATYATAPVILALVAHLANLEWEKPVELIDRALAAALPILEENWTNSRYFSSLFSALVGLAFCRGLLTQPHLSGEGSSIKKMFAKILTWGDTRAGLVPQVSTACMSVWLDATYPPAPNPAATASLLAHIPELVELALFGPLWERDKDDHKVDGAIALKLMGGSLDAEEAAEVKGTAGWNFSLQDYTVRVQANDLLSRLDPAVPEHAAIGKAVLARLLDMHLAQRFVARFTGTLEHRKQLRLWSTVQLVLPFVPASAAALEFSRLLACIELETILSTRYLIEWALIRLVLAFPTTAEGLWKGLVVLHVGPLMEVGEQRAFFEKAFVSILPWITSNHFTIRLIAQSCVHKFWNMAKDQPHLASLPASLPALALPAEFLAANADCVRHREKVSTAYFLGGGFHPLEDVTLEFIFRGALTVSMGSSMPDERISSTAFEKVNPAPGRRVPLRRPGQKREEWIPDSVVLETAPAAADDVSDAKAPKDAVHDAPIQKKIVPWESMMETDIDLSREREDRAKKPRNPLIVVASLVNKAPNLGGLCR